jgi:hypothetical protein
MANLMTGSIRRRVSKVGGAELVLTPVRPLPQGRCCAGIARTTPLEAIVVQGEKRPNPITQNPSVRPTQQAIAGHEETEAIVCPKRISASFWRRAPSHCIRVLDS